MKLQITVASSDYFGTRTVFTLFEDDKQVSSYEVRGKLGARAAWWVAHSLGKAKWGEAAGVSILMEKRCAP